MPVNNFYEEEDFDNIRKDILGLLNSYQKQKFDMTSRIDVISLREDLAVLNVQLSDISADIYGDSLEASRLREEFREEHAEKLLKQFAATAAKGKKVAYAEDTARRRAKIASMDLVKKENTLKTRSRRAIGLVLSVKDVLNAMAKRIDDLRPTNAEPVDFAPESSGGRPRPSGRYGDDGFDILHSEDVSSTSLGQLEDELLEMEEALNNDE